MRIKTLHDKIGKSATSDLIKKRQEEDDSYALWEIVEVLSFGHFIFIPAILSEISVKRTFQQLSLVTEVPAQCSRT